MDDIILDPITVNSSSFLNTIGRKSFKITLKPNEIGYANLLYNCEENCIFSVALDFGIDIKCAELLEYCTNNNITPFQALSGINGSFTIEKVDHNNSNNIVGTLQTGRLFQGDTENLFLFSKDKSYISLSGEEEDCCIINESINESLNITDCNLTYDLENSWKKIFFDINPRLYQCDDVDINQINDIVIGVIFINFPGIKIYPRFDNIEIIKTCNRAVIDKDLVSENFDFNIIRRCDNKKSWAKSETFQERFFDLKFRNSNYSVNHSDLVINSKEMDLQIDSSSYLECEVFKNLYNEQSCIVNDLSKKNIYVFYDDDIDIESIRKMSIGFKTFHGDLKNKNSEFYLENYTGNLYQMVTGSKRWLAHASFPILGMIPNGFLDFNNGPKNPLFNFTYGLEFLSYPVDIQEEGVIDISSMGFSGGDVDAYVVSVVKNTKNNYFFGGSAPYNTLFSTATNEYKEDFSNFINTYEAYDNINHFLVISGDNNESNDSLIQAQLAFHGRMVSLTEIIKIKELALVDYQDYFLSDSDYTALKNGGFQLLNYDNKNNGVGLKNFGFVFGNQLIESDFINQYNTIFNIDSTVVDTVREDFKLKLLK